MPTHPEQQSAQDYIPRGGKVVGIIDLTPTWAGLIPLFVAAIDDGTPTARQAAIGELYRLAEYADDMKGRQSTLLDALQSLLAECAPAGSGTYMKAREIAAAAISLTGAQ